MSRAHGPGFLLQIGDGGATPAGAGGSTTLAAVAPNGATVIKVVSVTGFTAGDIMGIGAIPGNQNRVALVVGTVGAGGTGITFTTPLEQAVPNGAPVIENLAEVFTTVAEVKDIRGPGLKRDVIDATNQSSPGGYEEVITSLKRSGELTFDCNFNPTDPTLDQTTGLLKAFEDGVRRSFKLMLTDFELTMWSFRGFVTGFDQTAPVAGILSANVTIKITGKPSLVPQS